MTLRIDLIDACARTLVRLAGENPRTDLGHLFQAASGLHRELTAIELKAALQMAIVRIGIKAGARTTAPRPAHSLPN